MNSAPRKPWHLRLRQRIESRRFWLIVRLHDRLFGDRYCRGYDW